MRITGTKDFKLNNTVVTIGKFDCFHKGHQLIFKTASEHKESGMEQVIFMFETNPNNVLKNDDGKYIVCRKERKNLSGSFGVDHLIEYPFDDETKNMTPEEFVKNVLVEKLGVKLVVCGNDFMFGKDRSGDADTLKELGRKYDFKVEVVDKLRYKGEIISSTRIRQELIKGNIEDVNNMLGRNFSVEGCVIRGSHIGSSNGIPTINIIVPDDKLLPTNGVYATKTCIDEKEYISITNIGIRPTFHNDSKKNVETYILDYNEDLYGENVKVLFFEYVRPEKKFDSPSDLYEQIDKDIIKTRNYFKNNGSK